MDSRPFRAALILTTVLASAWAAVPEPPAAPLAQLRRLTPAEPPTQILVLATFHFSELKDSFQPAMVDELLQRLTTFKPDLIAVEKLPGPLVHAIELRASGSSARQEILDGFASAHLTLGHEAQSLLHLDPIQAAKGLAAESVPPREPAAWAQRALRCLAAYELPSALLAWSWVPATDGHARAQVPTALAAKLDAELAKVNEVQALAVPLARRLGHASLYAVDEFEDLEAIDRVIPALMASEFKDSPLVAAIRKAPAYVQAKACIATGIRTGTFLEAYRYYNSPAFAGADVDGQWGLFLRTHVKNRADRGRLALWEERNLKIAGRIRALSAEHPGQRILVIYGAAHRPFLEAYLGACCDIQIVDPVGVLGQGPGSESFQPAP